MEYEYYVLREFGTMKYLCACDWGTYRLVDKPHEATLFESKRGIKSFLEDVVFLPEQEKFTVCTVNMKVTITNLE